MKQFVWCLSLLCIVFPSRCDHSSFQTLQSDRFLFSVLFSLVFLSLQNNVPYDVVAMSTLINVMLIKFDMIYVWLYAVFYVVISSYGYSHSLFVSLFFHLNKQMVHLKYKIGAEYIVFTLYFPSNCDYYRRRLGKPFVVPFIFSFCFSLDVMAHILLLAVRFSSGDYNVMRKKVIIFAQQQQKSVCKLQRTELENSKRQSLPSLLEQAEPNTEHRESET